MADRFLKRVGTKAVAYPLYLRQTQPSQYPSQWFVNNAEKKPEIVVRKFAGSVADMRLALLKMIGNGSIDRDFAKIYLVGMAKTMVMKLDSEWTSYKVNIANKDDDVTPLSLLNVVQTESYPDVDKLTRDKDESDKNVILYILTIYRIMRESNPKGKKNIIDNFKNQLDLGKNGTNSVTYVNAARLMNYSNWQSDSGYHKLVAAYDMFLHRFQSHELAPVRFGTIGSRYRDCAALQSIGELCDIVGLESHKLYEWIYTNQCADELMRMLNPADYDEVKACHSYFPYQMDFGLVTKTAYSSVANPNLFLFLHLTGALLGSERSRMARNTEYNLNDNMVNAIIMAYAFKKNAILQKARTSTGDDLIVQDETLEEGEVKGTDGSEWIKFMMRRRCQLTESQKQFVRAVKASITSPRDRTIGQYLSNYILFD